MFSATVHTTFGTHLNDAPACMYVGADIIQPTGQTLNGFIGTRFKHAVHVLMGDGRLFTLLCGITQQGMRIINITPTAWSHVLGLLSENSRVQINAHGLMHEQLHLHWEKVAVWHAPKMTYCKRPNAHAHLQKNLQQAQQWLQQYLIKKDYQQNIAWKAAYKQFGELISQITLLNKAKSLNTTDLDHAIRQLIGLGLGLTPSGDDMLAGYLIGLLAGDAHDTYQQLLTFIQRYWHTTTTASQDMLDQASKGWTTARIEDVLTALTMPETLGLYEALQAQCTIGHSSGIDTLIGLFAGLEHCIANNVYTSLVASLPVISPILSE